MVLTYVPEDLMEDDIINLAKQNDKTLVIGDFNARHEIRGNLTCNNHGPKLYNRINKTGLIFYATDEPTKDSDRGDTPSTINVVHTNGVSINIYLKTYSELID